MPVLTDSMPLYAVKKELDRHVVGYDKEKLMVFCLAVGHRLKNSTGALLVGPSSAGKSHVLNNVMKYFPVSKDIKEAKEKNQGMILTGITKKVLNYFVPPGGSWNHKILCVQELDGAVEAAAVIRTFLSEGMASTLVTEEIDGRFKASSFIVRGTPTLFVTSANDEIESQFGNRLNVIEIPGNQVPKVLEYEGNRFAYGKKSIPEHDAGIKKEISSMKDEEDVLVPYAPQLAKIWYRDTVVAQRTFQDFLKLIQCVTLLHQKHRERVDGLLVANLDDYEIARRIVKISKFKLGAGLLRAYTLIVDALTGNDDQYDQILKGGRKVRGITREQMSELIERSMVQIDRYLETLCDLGVLKTHLRYVTEQNNSVPDLKVGRNPNVYSLAMTTERDITFPSPRQLLGVQEPIKKLRFRKTHEGWFINKIQGIPLTFNAYNPLTGKEVDLDKAETIYMIDHKKTEMKSHA